MKNLPGYGAAWVLFTGAALADAAFDREIKEAKEQHDKAAKAALEPIDKRYRETLETLQKRAIAYKDPAAEKRIADELGALTSPVAGGTAKAQGSERKSLIADLAGTVWNWSGQGESLRFVASGKLFIGKKEKGSNEIKEGEWVPGKDGTVILTNEKRKKAVLKLIDEKNFDGTGFNGEPVIGKYSWGGDKR
jgi:hypothetical protein